MATLRKWQPAPRRQQKGFISPDRILMAIGCAAFAIALLAILQPGWTGGETRGGEDRLASARAKELANMKKAEADERARQQARIRLDQRQEQTRLFNQRYNTDRMPVGSVTTGAAQSSSAPTGFVVVKPAAATGFREVRMGRDGTPGQ